MPGALVAADPTAVVAAILTGKTVLAGVFGCASVGLGRLIYLALQPGNRDKRHVRSPILDVNPGSGACQNTRIGGKSFLIIG